MSDVVSHADSGGGHTDGAESVGVSVEDSVAVAIRRRREAAGLSQNALAKRAGFSREYVSRAERASHGLPSENLVAVLDTALDAGGALLELWHAAANARRSRRQGLSRSGTAAGRADEASGRRTRVGLVAEADPIEPDAHDAPKPGGAGERAGARVDRTDSDVWSRNAGNGSAALLAEIVATDIDPLTLDDIEERVDALAKGYFRTTPLEFRIAVVRLRQRVRDLVAARSTLSQRRRMYAALSALTGMLAESSFAIGVQTDIHCAAALALAQEAGHAGLVGWVRSTQAQIALHTGSPAAAARYAYAGQTASPRGSTALVRSAAYLARANARMGDQSAARQAWRSARSAWDGLDGALTDSVFSLSPEYPSYCELTMLVWLGDVGPSRQLADKEEHAGCAPTVGRAIGQIDIGLARVLSGEIDGAVQAGHRALAIGGSRLTTPLRDRFTDLANALAPFDVPAVHELRRRWMWISA